MGFGGKKRKRTLNKDENTKLDAFRIRVVFVSLVLDLEVPDKVLEWSGRDFSDADTGGQNSKSLEKRKQMSLGPL